LPQRAARHRDAGTRAADGLGYFMMWGLPTATASADQRRTYFCYVFNSKLITATTERFKYSQLRPSSEVVLMLEKMMTPGETKPAFSKSIGRAKASWERASTRHRKALLPLCRWARWPPHLRRSQQCSASAARLQPTRKDNLNPRVAAN
jgi:hypothetical protein